MLLTQPAVNYGAGHPACKDFLEKVIDLAEKKDLAGLIEMGFFNVSYSRAMGVECLGNMPDVHVKTSQLSEFKSKILESGVVRFNYDKNRVYITLWSR